jgi:hypothetical protein
MEGYNLIIHKSHTKQYLIKVIQLLNLPIPYNNLSKNQLLEEVDAWIYSNIDIEFNDNLLEMTTIHDLISYLATAPEKDTDYKTIKDKQLLMVKARQVMAYVNNGQDLNRSFYKNFSDVMADGAILAKQGTNIPTCRRAVYLLNNTLPPKDKLSLAINKYTLEELKYKLSLKKNKQPIFKSKQGKFLITF